jgi:hypothetical protein
MIVVGLPGSTVERISEIHFIGSSGTGSNSTTEELKWKSTAVIESSVVIFVINLWKY